MKDFRLCRGDGCLLALKCRRYTEYVIDNADYFTDAPYRVTDDKTQCDYFYNSDSSEITQQKETNGSEGDNTEIGQSNNSIKD